MSWLFSQALVAAYSADTCSAGAPSAPSNGNPTPQAYLSPDKMTAFSRLSRFGMTFAALTDARGAALLTSYLAAFPARTSAPPARGGALMASAAASGAKWPESSVKYCRASSSWKTHRSLWDEALPWSSVTLPRWGMTLDGVVLQHPTRERPISATDSGLWPTPNVPNGGRSCAHVTDWRGKTAYHNGKKVQVGLEHAARYWPTPTVCGNYNRACLSPTSGDGLATAVAKWPTPTKSDHKGSGQTMLRSDGKLRGDRLDYATERNPDGSSTGGQLNPTWVEWLMGWPLGWTDLKPLATDKFRAWQQQHGGF